jgi:hypothetical protein
MQNFIIKRTWRIHNYGQKCDFVNYLTGAIFTNCFGTEYFQPDIGRALICDSEPLKKYLGEDCNLTIKHFYPEGDFVDKKHITPDYAYKQEYIEVKTESEQIVKSYIAKYEIKKYYQKK